MTLDDRIKKIEGMIPLIPGEVPPVYDWSRVPDEDLDKCCRIFEKWEGPLHQFDPRRGSSEDRQYVDEIVKRYFDVDAISAELERLRG